MYNVRKILAFGKLNTICETIDKKTENCRLLLKEMLICASTIDEISGLVVDIIDKERLSYIQRITPLG